MKSLTTRRFWAAYHALPEEIQVHAGRAYRIFSENPGHPSLRFKKVSGTDPIYSVRVTLNYRALGLLEGEEITWFWIGNHRDYDRLLAEL